MQPLQEKNESIIFADSIKTLSPIQHRDYVVHVLCLNGAMSFLFHETHFNIVATDYLIIPTFRLARAFAQSSDFKGIVMALEDRFVSGLTLKSNYGVFGHLSLLNNPVMQLSPQKVLRCQQDLIRIRERLLEGDNPFNRELVEHLLMAHILDLYSIHAEKNNYLEAISGRNAELVNRFVRLLMQGDFRKNRNLDYYADKLFVSSHYLSEVCRKVSVKGASYFIERFTIQEISKLLYDQSRPLSRIAEELNFSSLSYFSRFVKQQLGMTPSEFRNSLHKNR